MICIVRLMVRLLQLLLGLVESWCCEEGWYLGCDGVSCLGEVLCLAVEGISQEQICRVQVGTA